MAFDPTTQHEIVIITINPDLFLFFFDRSPLTSADTEIFPEVDDKTIDAPLVTSMNYRNRIRQ